jgi:hypothetical protein
MFGFNEVIRGDFSVNGFSLRLLGHRIIPLKGRSVKRKVIF